MKLSYKILNLRFGLLIITSLIYTQCFAVDIVGYSLLTGTNGAATTGVGINYPGLGRALTAYGLLNSSFSSNGITATSWDNTSLEGFSTNAFSTIGYISIAVSGQIKASSTGPLKMIPQYSLNGLTWISVTDLPAFSDDNPNLVLTTQLLGFKFRLPSVCDNKPLVYVRWIQNGTQSVGGGTVTSSGSVSLKAVVMQADAFAAPTSQVSQISFLSTTPTSITVGCTPGNGNHRIIKINTENSFTDPINDENPIASTIYGGSGEQVIYNGTETSVTITVPSSLSKFWFRYYESNQMDNLYRYNILDNIDNRNPKQCALPYVYLPTHSFGLINASLGGTVLSNDASDLIDMGVRWSTESGVDINSSVVQSSSPQFGSFNVNTEVVRGSNIYYRAYAENESGVYMSEESSFSNVPIFEKDGDWESAALWSTKEVPGAFGDLNYGSVTDKPIINANCALTQNNKCQNLVINEGSKLTINPSVFLEIVDTLINNAHSDGLLIKASENLPNASLIFLNPFANSDVSASVEMYSPAKWNLATNTPVNERFNWQYFGIPVSQISAISVFTGAYVRYWDETGTNKDNHWIGMADNSVLQPFNGYELCQSSPKIYRFQGKLVVSNFSKNSLNYTTTALYPGQHIFSNPYVAAMNISALQTAFGSNIEQAVYLYNTGSYGQWENTSGNSITGSLPGQYIVSTPATCGIEGVPAEIPSMQAFLVKAIQNDIQNSSLSFSYSDVVKQNSERQRAKSKVFDDQNLAVLSLRLDASKYSDKLWFFVKSDLTPAFDNGWDGRKLFCSNSLPQLYSKESDGLYQIDGTNNLNNNEIVFIAGYDTSYTLTITKKNIEKFYKEIYLLDKYENKVLELQDSVSTYTFSSCKGIKQEDRFKLIATYYSNQNKVKNDSVTIIQSDKNIYVQNKSSDPSDVFVHDTSGRCLFTNRILPDCVTKLQFNPSSGVYLVTTKSTGYVKSQQIIF